jgi:pyochelin biosynthetic protein PchC
VRLVCLPHAGGNAQAFHGWAARLPADVEVLAVRYPGRQERIGEPCVTTMDELAGRVTAALEHYRRGGGDTDDGIPLALFGHSMGASLAYEVTVRLEAAGRGPALLMLSARNAPHRTRRTALYRAADDVLVAGVRRLGTLGGDVYDIPELRELLLPVLRADYELIETYHPADPARIATPVTAYLGEQDRGTCVDAVAAWDELADGGFTLRTFPGDHFYLAPCEAELTADIAARLAHLADHVPEQAH